jgi:hypothetical protein
VAVAVGTSSCCVVWCRGERSNANDEKTRTSALPQISTLEGVTVQDGESRSMRRETNRLRPHCVKQYRQADGASYESNEKDLACFPRCKGSITNNDDDNNNDNSNSEKRIMNFSRRWLCLWERGVLVVLRGAVEKDQMQTMKQQVQVHFLRFSR